MFRKIGILALLGALTLTVASAGDKKAAAPSPDEMKAEMMKCAICKNMGPHMDELMPVMKMEMVTLNNGFAMVCNLSDSAKLPLYHSIFDKMSEAGKKAEAMSPEEAKANLCQFCQGIHGFLSAGGGMSMGKTKTGDLMVFSSDKPELKARLTEMQNMCAMMMPPAAN